jgi:hypothetical protein
VTKYTRRWDCAVCGKPVIYDTKEYTLSCDCETIKIVPLAWNDLTTKFERLQQ